MFILTNSNLDESYFYKLILSPIYNVLRVQKTQKLNDECDFGPMQHIVKQSFQNVS